jgi:hypothetical protein
MSKEQLIERAAQTATYGGSAGAVFFGLSANEFAAIAGVLIGVLGLILQAAITIYFKHQHLALARAAAEAKPQCEVCPDRKRDDD